MKGETLPPAPGVRMAAVSATALGVAGAALISVATPYPSLASPYSLAVVIPYLWSGGSLVPAAMLAGLFMLSGSRLAAGRLKPPSFTGFLFVILGPVSLWFAAWGIRPGLRHYGAGHTFGILAADALMILALCILLIRARRRPAFPVLLAFHGLFWAWLAWIGLPWLRQLF